MHSVVKGKKKEKVKDALNDVELLVDESVQKFAAFKVGLSWENVKQRVEGEVKLFKVVRKFIAVTQIKQKTDANGKVVKKAKDPNDRWKLKRNFDEPDVVEAPTQTTKETVTVVCDDHAGYNIIDRGLAGSTLYTYILYGFDAYRGWYELADTVHRTRDPPRLAVEAPILDLFTVQNIYQSTVRRFRIERYYQQSYETGKKGGAPGHNVAFIGRPGAGKSALINTIWNALVEDDELEGPAAMTAKSQPLGTTAGVQLHRFDTHPELNAQMQNAETKICFHDCWGFEPHHWQVRLPVCPSVPACMHRPSVEALHWQVGRSVGRLVGWSVGRLVGWLFGPRLVGC
jgi:hypothetical protein